MLQFNLKLSDIQLPPSTDNAHKNKHNRKV